MDAGDFYAVRAQQGLGGVMEMLLTNAQQVSDNRACAARLRVLRQLGRGARRPDASITSRTRTDELLADLI
jgi:hypothetical protein